jgi:RimJ/RimL family protein N-acetyltransferase
MGQPPSDIALTLGSQDQLLFIKEIPMNPKPEPQPMSAYPMQVELKGITYTIREMTEEDGDLLLSFAQSLSAHDKLYMRRDITQQSGIDEWLVDLRAGTIHTLLAIDEQGVAGYTTVHRNKITWTRHVADLRMATAERARRQGLGRVLVREGFNIALDLGIEKITARMTPDQHGAKVLFAELGFTPEALLKDYVKDHEGNYHDMLMKGCSVNAFLAQREAYGVSEN